MAKASKTETPKTQPAEETYGKKKHYQEWKVEIRKTGTGPVAEKLKVHRERVLITDEQANILNESVLHGGSNQGVMYFPA